MGLKGRAREKARPKRGKMEIDYKKLQDAFFVYVIAGILHTHKIAWVD